jgi:hypothetical protein
VFEGRVKSASNHCSYRLVLFTLFSSGPGGTLSILPLLLLYHVVQHRLLPRAEVLRSGERFDTGTVGESEIRHGGGEERGRKRKESSGKEREREREGESDETDESDEKGEGESSVESRVDRGAK